MEKKINTGHHLCFKFFLIDMPAFGIHGTNWCLKSIGKPFLKPKKLKSHVCVARKFSLLDS